MSMKLMTRVKNKQVNREQTSGADGVKIAVLRKGRARLVFIYAAAHRRRSAPPG